MNFLKQREKNHRLAFTIVAVLLLLLLLVSIRSGRVWAGEKENDTFQYKKIKTILLKQDLFLTNEDWYADGYEAFKGEEVVYDIKYPAKICFWNKHITRAHDCFISHFPMIGDIKTVELHREKEPQKAVIFLSNDIIPTLGAYRMISFFVYDNKQDKFIKVFDKFMNAISEYKIFPQLENTFGGIFVYAQRIWDAKTENHLYGEKHRFRVEIYQYSAEGKFLVIDSYITKKKYLTEDVLLEDYGVIKSEFGHIINLLKKDRR